MVELSRTDLIKILSKVGDSPRYRPEFVGGDGIHGVEFDSRNVKPRNLFIGLKGETSHGEKFLDQAFSAGASVCLVENAELVNHSAGVNVIAVKDSLKAFWAIGNWWRRRSQATFVAITGSVGKTTTKELLGKVLSLKCQGTYSQKSFNNQTGVPYTLCQVRKDDRWAVVEIGMNHAGEIEALSKIVEPHVAVVTCVAPVHIGNFNSLQEIADAKCEIFEGLSSHGLCIINNDDELLKSKVQSLGLGKEKVKTFGFAAGSDMHIEGFSSRGLDGISFQISNEDQSIVAKMKLIGRHNAYNTACAALCARVLFPPFFLTSIKSTLDIFSPPGMRMNVVKIGKSRKVIDDSYNASPPSMMAALDLLSELKQQGSRIGAVLGDMRELGDFGEAYHKAIADRVVSERLDYVVTVGDYSSIISDEAHKHGIDAVHAKSPEEAAEIINRTGAEVIFVKGSRAVGLDRTVNTLKELNSGT